MELPEVDDKPGREIFFDRVFFVNLLQKMIGLVNVLKPHQREFHIAHHIDLYWYIQKIKELEILMLRLEQGENLVLSNYLKHLEQEIQSHLRQDELFIRQHPIFCHD